MSARLLSECTFSVVVFRGGEREVLAEGLGHFEANRLWALQERPCFVVEETVTEETIDLTCDRCGVREEGIAVDAVHLTQQATKTLCPGCVGDEPHHLPGNWLLPW